jgi:hypothetical protein
VRTAIITKFAGNKDDLMSDGIEALSSVKRSNSE